MWKRKGGERSFKQTEEAAFPSWLWGRRPITLYSFQPQEEIRAGKPPVWHVTVSLLMFLCPYSNISQSAGMHESLQFVCRPLTRPVNDITLTDIHHQHYHTDFILITISTIRADPPVMRKLEPDCRCLGKWLTSDGKIVMQLPEMVTSSHWSNSRAY